MSPGHNFVSSTTTCQVSLPMVLHLGFTLDGDKSTDRLLTILCCFTKSGEKLQNTNNDKSLDKKGDYG
jgi:hypothetical protein